MTWDFKERESGRLSYAALGEGCAELDRKTLDPLEAEWKRRLKINRVLRHFESLLRIKHGRGVLLESLGIVLQGSNGCEVRVREEASKQARRLHGGPGVDLSETCWVTQDDGGFYFDHPIRSRVLKAVLFSKKLDPEELSGVYFERVISGNGCDGGREDLLRAEFRETGLGFDCGQGGA